MLMQNVSQRFDFMAAPSASYSRLPRIRNFSAQSHPEGRPIETIGSPVEASKLREGKLGSILWDTSLVSEILDGREPYPWIRRVLKNSPSVICAYTLIEYGSIIWAGKEFQLQDIIGRLEEVGIALSTVPGLYLQQRLDAEGSNNAEQKSREFESPEKSPSETRRGESG
ncbi:hypothetical protein TWF481_006252 [Arthrobotrys musiformis]|uniref:PIN domain-containing protein n=1 Tax=Arthrobotrys musiformis TaxID=47236 RepID=A0AAV9WHB7_9PEZI